MTVPSAHHLRLASEADVQLARHGYRAVFVSDPPLDGWHLLWSPDHGNPAARTVCLGWVPSHRLGDLPRLLAEAGWPTGPKRGWSCPVHGPFHPDDPKEEPCA